MDLNKQAEQASNTMMGVIGIFIKFTIGLGLFFSFLFKASKARKALREQYLLGSIYTQIEQKITEEIKQKEDKYFQLIWKFFHGLSTNWATFVSFVVTTIAITILNDIIFGVVIQNESVQGFIRFLNFWPLLFLMIFYYRPKFKHYLSLLPEDTTSLMAIASQYGLGTPDGKPTQEFLKQLI